MKPADSLLVADAMTGQDAVTLAKSFAERVGITGIVLTRVDGDARGGAALSMRAVTGKPIKFLGTGEKLDAIEPFRPERIAGRILDMGDVISLVEKAAETIEQEDAEKLAKKMAKGQFDLDDLAAQLRQVRKMGGMGGIMGMLPGVQKIKKSAQRGQSRREPDQASGSDHRLDDQEGTARSEAAERVAAAAHRGGVGHHGAGDQPPPETVSGHGDDDEKDEQARPEGLMRHGIGALLPGGGFGR